MTSSSEQGSHEPAGGFVGRAQELAELDAALEQISARGRAFMISGEPGIGKTRLADELSAEAWGRGVRVAWGRCWEGGGHARTPNATDRPRMMLTFRYERSALLQKVADAFGWS